MSQPAGELVPYQGQQQLVLPASLLEAVQSGDIVDPEVAYLATDVVQGVYGVAAFGLVVPRPQARPIVYPEGAGGSCDDTYTEEEKMNLFSSPLERSHYFKTTEGFALLRTVAAPQTVFEKLREDKFLGPALIDKACHEGTIEPDGFDEERRLDVYESLGLEISEALEPVETRILQGLGTINKQRNLILRQFVSWHSYRAYAPVLEAVSEAGRATVANFDRVLGVLLNMQPLPVFEQSEQTTTPEQKSIGGEA